MEYHYQKAFAIDSTFLVPIVELVASKINESDYYFADSLLNFISQKSQHLSRAHQLQTKAYAAQLRGNLNQSVNYWEKVYEIDTKEFIALTNLSRQYLNTNQAQKALMILEQFDPTFLNFKECEPCQEYYELLTYAHFQLSDYQKVISIIERFDFDIKEGLIANYYLKSLVHQGSFDKAFDKLGLYLGENLTFNGGRQSSGLLLVGLIFELQNLNQPDVAKVMANLLISYGENREQDWISDYYLGVGHYAKKDFEEAAFYFKKFL